MDRVTYIIRKTGGRPLHYIRATSDNGPSNQIRFVKIINQEIRCSYRTFPKDWFVCSDTKKIFWTTVLFFNYILKKKFRK